MATMQLEDESLKQCRENAVKDVKENQWLIKNECLHHIRKNRSGRKPSLQLVLPLTLREEVMKAHHDELLGGHTGFWATVR